MNLLDLMVKIGVDDQATSKIGSIGSSITDKLGSAVKTVGKVVAAGTAAAAGGAVAIATTATKSYAQFEQLEGGVSKLYGTASDKMMAYAQGAYRTSGMSMNQYMEQATSFSAALIKSLGGDVDKAADQTDKAMRLMSDNVNTFGTNAQDVQNAIQGLSRENFTMLDNMKLGYSGTKEGMQQLIKDANDYAGLTGTNNELTIDSFSDMIDAIDIIQQKQHIWGTTAKEASTTIEGSVNMTKAAWENFLTSLGTGKEDMIRQSVGGIINGIFGTWNDEAGKRVGGIIQNVAPVVARVGSAIMTEIPSLTQSIGYIFAETIANALGIDTSYDQPIDELLGKIGEVMAKKVPEKIKGLLSDALGALFGESGTEAVNRFFETFDVQPFVDAFDRLKEAGSTFIGMLTENLPSIGEFLGTAGTILGDILQAGATIVQILTPFLPSILAAFAAIKAVGIGMAAVNLITTIGTALGTIQTFGGAITALVTILGGPVTVIAAIVAAIIAFVATNEGAREAIINAWNAVVAFFSGIPAWWDGVWSTIKANVANFVSGVISKWEEFRQKTSQTWENLKVAVIGTALNLISDVQGKFRDFLQTASSIWNNLKTAIVGIALNLASDVQGKFRELLQFATSTWENIKSTVTNAFTNAKDTVINAASNLYDGVREKFDSVVSFVGGIPDRIVGALGDLGSLLWNSGESVMNGFWDGMSAIADSIYDWVSGIADTIYNLKGPLPYDRKVLVDNGIALMYGLQKGLEKGFEDEVRPYVSGMGLDVASSIDVSPMSRTVAATNAVTVSVGELVVREEADINRIAERLYDLSNREAAWSMSYSVA